MQRSISLELRIDLALHVRRVGESHANDNSDYVDRYVQTAGLPEAFRRPSGGRVFPIDSSMRWLKLTRAQPIRAQQQVQRSVMVGGLRRRAVQLLASSGGLIYPHLRIVDKQYIETFTRSLLHYPPRPHPSPTIAML